MQEVVSGGDILEKAVDVVTNSGQATDDITQIIQTIDSDLLQQIADKLEVTNTLLLRISEQIDFFGAVFVAVVIVAVCYTILKGFSRF